MAGSSSQAGGILPESLDDCIELYFECETPEERDGFVRLFAERRGEAADAFLRAMMVEDEDEFVRLAAARVLAERGDEDAQRLLAESLAVSADDALLEAAIEAAVDIKQKDAIEPLTSLFVDEERSLGERRLAQDGLIRADASQAATLFVSLLEKATPIENEIAEGMMPALIDAPEGLKVRARRAIAQRMQMVDAKRRQLEGALQGVPEGDDREIALDQVDEAREAWERLSSCAMSLSSDGTAA